MVEYESLLRTSLRLLHGHRIKMNEKIFSHFIAEK